MIYLFVCVFISFVWLLGSQSEREDKVSLELSEEVLQSMEVGISFRDYVRESSNKFLFEEHTGFAF